MDETAKLLKRCDARWSVGSTTVKERSRCIDGITVDEAGYVTDPKFSEVPDIRSLPRSGGCGLSNNKNFDEVLFEAEKIIKENEKRIEKEFQEKEEAEATRIKNLSTHELLMELYSLMKSQFEPKPVKQQFKTELEREQQKLSGIGEEEYY